MTGIQNLRKVIRRRVVLFLFGTVYICVMIGFSMKAPNSKLGNKPLDRGPVFMNMAYTHTATQNSVFHTSRDKHEVDFTPEVFRPHLPVDGYYEDLQQSSNISKNRKQLNVYFLKVHKTGSSTFRNILQRLVLNHNLSTPVFRERDSYPSRNMLHKLVPIETILHTQEQPVSTEEAIRQNQCNVICVHTVFNKTQINTIMPQDTLFVASIREPFSHFKSSFNFWKLSEKYGIPSSSDTLLEYFRNVDKYEKLLPGSFYKAIAEQERVLLSYSKNYMSYEYGFEPENLLNGTYVNEHLQFINKTFKSVIILEKYDESLMLLRQNTHWTFEELLYVKQRNERYSFKAKNYSSDIIKQHRDMSPIDYRMYDMFRERHDNLVHFAGSRFQDELKAFRFILKIVHRFCLPILYKVKSIKCDDLMSDITKMTIVINATEFNDSFIMTGAKCLLLYMSEMFLRTAVKLAQYPSICETESAWKYAGLSEKRFNVFCGRMKKMIFNISYDICQTQGVW